VSRKEKVGIVYSSFNTGAEGMIKSSPRVHVRKRKTPRVKKKEESISAGGDLELKGLFAGEWGPQGE